VSTPRVAGSRIMERTYACAPSLRAMKGSSDQSFSTPGSLPSSTPSHVSTSGPLPAISDVRLPSFTPLQGPTYLAWWKSTMQTIGANPAILTELTVRYLGVRVANTVTAMGRATSGWCGVGAKFSGC